MRVWIGIVLAAALATAVLAACSFGPDFTVRERMELGDRYMSWGLVYYNSWLRDRNQKYLDLAREHTQHAVREYFELQLALGHAYPDFYVLDKRRLRGCRFLREIDGAAARNRVELSDAERDGCLR